MTEHSSAIAATGLGPRLRSGRGWCDTLEARDVDGDDDAQGAEGGGKGKTGKSRKRKKKLRRLNRKAL